MNAQGADDMTDYFDALLGEAPAAPATDCAVPAPPAPAQPGARPAAVDAAPAATTAPVALVARPVTPSADAASTATSPISSSSRWLRVVVDGASYALELLRVQEVVRVVPIVPMRGTAPAVLGAMNLRGRIVPVFDLGLWLRTGSVAVGEQSRIVVVERNDELIGLLVDAVEDVVTLGRDRIEPPLPGNAPGMVLGVARVGATPTVLFDAYALYG
jgi:purine-binding chemotaxis protein CheW